MSRTPLLIALTLLVIADCILTTIAVGHMGATELNPICGWTGLDIFIMLKILVSAGVIGMFVYFSETPRITTTCVTILCVLYAGVLAWNLWAIL